MAINNSPVFAQSGMLSAVQVTTENDNVDGATGTYSTAITMDADGALVDVIHFKAAGNTTAGMVRIFFADDGTNYRLIGEVEKDLVTYDDETKTWEAQWTPPAGQANCPGSSKWKFAITDTETVNCFIFGQNL